MPVDSTVMSELAAIDLFSNLSRKALENIAAQTRVVEHPSGREITEEGGGATGFHLIRSGTATVTVHGEQRAQLGPGDYFGEISLIDGKPRSATVTADGPLTTLSLASWSFKPILDEHAEVSRVLLNIMCARLRALETKA